jgi:hypothetical protein
MTRKVYEHRFEITLVDHGANKTQANQIKFTGDEPKEFIRVVKPIIDRAFETWARDVEKSVARVG